MKKMFIIFFLLFSLMVIASCAAGDERFTAENPAGFWAGLWHGFISLITFIISIFNKNVGIYEVNNTGVLYNLGFILGVYIFFGSGSSSIKIKNKASKFEKFKKETTKQVKEEVLTNINKWASELEGKDYESNKDFVEDIEEKIRKDFDKWEN